MKTRDLSPYGYFQALEREYICLEIRSKIYYYKDDKDYFRKLMDKKKKSIENISQKNRLFTIFQDHNKYLEVWNEIVPEFGLPKFIYNTPTNTKQMQFPYKGTVVRSIVDQDIIGICRRIDFKSNTVEVLCIGSENEEVIMVPLSEVERLTPALTDEYYYFLPNNQFRIQSEEAIAKLQHYNLDNRVGSFKLGDEEIQISHEELSRIL